MALNFLKRVVNFFLHPFTSEKNETKTIYYSSNLIVVDKAYDQKINSNDEKEVTVQTYLRKNYPELACPRLTHEFYFVHRLDYSTSGVMCIPTNRAFCALLSKAFEQRQVKKYYVAIVRGWVTEELSDVIMPVGEDVRDIEMKRMCTSDMTYCHFVKPARTVFYVLEKGYFEGGPATKLLVRPTSGRRHQIRVHCKYMGHIIVGDYTYSDRKETKPRRMYLHSLRLVSHNVVEAIDISTPDPFEGLVTDMVEEPKILDEETYKIIDSICPSHV